MSSPTKLTSNVVATSNVVFRLEPVATVAESVVEANKFAELRKSKSGIPKMIFFAIRMIARQRPELFYPLVALIAYSIVKGYIRWYTFPLLFIAAAIIIIGLLVLRRYHLVKRDLSPAPSVKTLSCYQSPELLTKAWALPVAKLYDPIIIQPVEGYCGQATVLNVINSVPTHRHVPRLPPQARPITLGEMKAICDQLDTFDHQLRVIKVEALDNMTITEFQSHMEQLNNPGVRYLANFLRSPLFFNDSNPAHRVNVLKRLFGGHWSPLGGYLSESSLVHVLDVNESYGTYLVPVQRLYDAINTYDLSNGKPRGLIRIEFGV